MTPFYGMYNNPLVGNQMNFPPQQNTPQDERIWVQNETSAEAYLVAPNGFVRLWDSNKPVFYEKRADASGRPYPIEVFEYKRRQAPAPQVEECMPSDLDARFEALSKRIEVLENAKKGVKSNAKQQPAADDGAA